jgi:Prokaryotic E2 family A/Prokaryotic homologs of the JAB domain
MPDYAVIGEPLTGDLPDALTLPAASATWHAVQARREFTFIEARRIERPDGYAEILIVDCENDGVPTRNAVGIEYRERLGLLFHSNAERMPEVRALRRGFPYLAHQNQVTEGDPPSLCLYVTRWSEVRRTWTPEIHLSRILWWLAEAASETLHSGEQPLEQMYFDSPYELVLPFDFVSKIGSADHRLVIAGRVSRGQNATLVGRMAPVTEKTGATVLPCVVVALPPVIHGRIEPFPATLGALDEQLASRGASVTELLRDAVRNLCQEGQFQRPDTDLTLLVVAIPLVREAGAEPERVETRGFGIGVNVADLGVAIGALEKVNAKDLNGVKGDKDGSAFLAVRLIGSAAARDGRWRDQRLDPVTLIDAFTPAMGRRMAGLSIEGPTGVLAGFGALGSRMFDLWTRSGWGNWSIIDPDHLRPHNLARHSTNVDLVGWNKATAGATLSGNLYPGQPPFARGIADRADNVECSDVREALDGSDIVVDVTTELGVPRILAGRDSVRRVFSAFITPSGLGSVLLAENFERTIRLDSLEAQYYRQVIAEDWGATHLSGDLGHVWTGAGCRDLSAIIPGELVALHAANLSRMIRVRFAEPGPAMLVWRYEPETGAVHSDRYEPAMPRMTEVRGLRVVWDDGLRRKLRGWREKHFPNETGGVLLGYFDLQMRSVSVVDALPAPADSKEQPGGFIRGTEGLEEAVTEAGRRTANIVRYIGEWHSHPPKHGAGASSDDVILLTKLAIGLREEGLPALMLIVGEGEERWYGGRVL